MNARSVRSLMSFMLSPTNSADYIKRQEPIFADIQAWILSLEPPKYAFEINSPLAERGKEAGYQAPPLDGIWATAPYFHNASAPTVYHVLNSKSRPKVFTRSYRTAAEDYDPLKLGWKITELDSSPASDLDPRELRKIYDTTQPGRGNGGHTFGDRFTKDERTAVIEYLKTL